MITKSPTEFRDHRLLPSLNRQTRLKSNRIGCLSNLKHIGLAFRIFATDHNDQFPMRVLTNKIGSFKYLQAEEGIRYWQAMSNGLSTPKLLFCRADKRKEAANFAQLRKENISYFLGLDAAENRPQALLAGDRNLAANGVPLKPGLVKLTTDLTLGWTAKMHQHKGNVILGDGSGWMRDTLRMSDHDGTKWIMIP
ncbi:MAG: type II secretion system protein [Verrucomicrobiota bacterium]